MTQAADVGMVGLGTMGGNLLLNIADHGFHIAGLTSDPAKRDSFRQERSAERITIHLDEAAFVQGIRRPRAILLLVPAGAPVDGVCEKLAPRLEAGDMIVDAGNSFFRDTDRRVQAMAAKGLHFFGMGVSGGEKGARFGPSLMPGGSADAYERLRPTLEAIAAKVGGAPCVELLGSGSAGHYVKMVHNGIEYGLMQLISESYDLLRRGVGLNNDELAETYRAWNGGELNGFLMEITAAIFPKVDERTGKRLVDVIRDAARQKGTGQWTSQEALDLRVPAPNIDLAVMMRDLSGREAHRAAAQRALRGLETSQHHGDRGLIGVIRGALYAATIITYAQGLTLLRAASEAYKYGLSLEKVARVWRGGCIIRAALLEDIRAAYQANPELVDLTVDPGIARKLMTCEADLRLAVTRAVEWGIPAPGLMMALAYYDAYRSPRLALNLIQAQRDFFGAHTYERVDAEGVFHTQWD